MSFSTEFLVNKIKMKSFKQILRKIREDKIIAKEDEGGMSAGEVSSPSSSHTNSGDITTSKPGNSGFISTTDILGHCDHKKDGFFGPGCFHRPFPVFSQPISRIPKPKKKIKVQDLTEGDDFQIFSQNSAGIIDSEIKDINKYLQKINGEFNCSYDENYKFSDEKVNWVSSLENVDSNSIKNPIVAINLPVIYGLLSDNSLENDEIELRCLIRAALWHEIGHAIINYFRDLETYDFEMSESEEENVVLEFTSYIMREYTGNLESRLANFIDGIFC